MTSNKAFLTFFCVFMIGFLAAQDIVMTWWTLQLKEIQK